MPHTPLSRVKSVDVNLQSPIIVISNRLPFVLKPLPNGLYERKASAGGLVTAVAPVVVQAGGMWIGWPGIHPEDTHDVRIPESKPGDTTPTADLKSNQVVSVHMDKHMFNEYYNGCCNGTFWPLFHSMPDKTTFLEEHWLAYKKVNDIFAERAIHGVREFIKKRKSRPGLNAKLPIVWVHDYHLMLVPSKIRTALSKERLQCKLSFFLHIPFPSWDIFRLFQWDAEILIGLLGCDLIGFHIEDYCINFIDCCYRRLGCRVDRKNMLVEFEGRAVLVRPLPISIPYSRFVQMATDAPKVIKEDENTQVILGVDRLDYTKGIVNRIHMLERLLERNPEHIGKIILLQIAVPSRTDVKEYKELKDTIDHMVGRVNGKFSTANWSPIRYIYGGVTQDELAAFYRDASIALVTPLRDGMNLVAKEFVACQVDKPGVLILSPFAGAGEAMREALTINPYELNNSAEVIHRALCMSTQERELRMKHLQRRERSTDVTYWMKLFLKSLGKLDASDDTVKFLENLSTEISAPTVEEFDKILGRHVGGDLLCLMLDYDGTLVPYANKPQLAFLTEETKHILQVLSNINDVKIVIMSGRSIADIKNMVSLDGLVYVGSHGLEIDYPGGGSFVHPIPEEFKEKVTSLNHNLQNECCVKGAWVENKGTIMTYHYREVPLEDRKVLTEKAREIIKDAGFLSVDAHCAIEAKPPIQWDQGQAAINVLRTIYGLDWIERVKVIFACDDNTPQESVRVLKGVAFTVSVSNELNSVSCHANLRLPSTDAIHTLLKWVNRHMSERLPETRKSSVFPKVNSSLYTLSPR